MYRMIVLMLMIVGTGLSAAEVDFTGTWVMNEEKSEFGEGRFGRMAARKMVVQQSEDTLKIERTWRGRNDEERLTTEELTLDGKEVTKTSEWGESVMSASWQDKILVINTTRNMSRNGDTFKASPPKNGNLPKMQISCIWR